MRSWPPLTFVVALALDTTPALAISDAGGPCTVPQHLSPDPGETVPANAPALVMSMPAPGPLTPADLAFELRGPDGTPVVIEAEPGPESSEGLLYIWLREQLPVGRNELSFRDFCSGEPNARRSYFVDVVAPSGLPERIGEVSMSVSDADFPHCRGHASRLWVEVTPSPELLAYRAVARATVRWKGDDISSAALGAGWMGGRMRTSALGCHGDSAVESGRLSVSFHVAGASSDPPPIEMDVSLRCPDKAGLPPCEAGAPPDGRQRPSPDGDPRSSTDGGAADAAAAQPRRGGCAVRPASGSSSSGLTVLALLLPLALLARRRR